jgi:hypothetical protein
MPVTKSVIDGLDKTNFSQCPIAVPMDTAVGTSFRSWEGIRDFHRYIVGCVQYGTVFELFWVARVSRDRTVFYRSMYDRSRLSIGDEAVLDQWIAIAERPPATEQPPAHVEPIPVSIAYVEPKTEPKKRTPKAEPKAETPKVEPVEVLEVVETYEFTYDEETPLPLLKGAISNNFKRYPRTVSEDTAIGYTIPDSQPLNVVWITSMAFADGEITIWYFYAIDGGLMEYRKAVYSSASLSPEDTQTLRGMWVCSRTPIATVGDSDEF